MEPLGISQKVTSTFVDPIQSFVLISLFSTSATPVEHERWDMGAVASDGQVTW